MADQTGKNISVVFKAEPDFGVPDVTVTGATVFRASPSSGLSLKKASILPTEFRKDGMTVQARHGSRSVDGEYMADLSVGTFDPLLEAAFRGTWHASFTITQADVTSVTTLADGIVGTSGSFITLGVKVGDVIVLASFTDAANNSRNLRVTAVTASKISVAEILTINASGDTSFTITVSKRLVQGNPPVARSFAFEQYLQDIDGSKLFMGVRVTGLTLSFKPDATVQVTFKCMGQDMQALTGAAAPYYTSPTISTSIPLVVVDGKVRANGTDVIDFTAFDVTFDLGGAVQATLGSLTSPDVFTNNAKVTAKLSALQSDLSNLNLFLDETAFDIAVLCVEPMSEPKHFTSFYFGNCLPMSNDAPIGSDNALIESIDVNVGIDQAGGAHSSTMIQVNSSAA